MSGFPVVITSAGVQPTPPTTILAALIAQVTSTNPGYTANLPASLIEDVSSTEVAGLAEMDQARVDAINSVSPYAANDFTLLQLGQQFIGQGSAPGIPTNTSVNVIFTAIDTATSAPAPGVVIGQGFIVGDGTYQYIVQDDVVTDSAGQTPITFCIATISGQWAVAANTVSQIVSSEPSGITLSVTNPSTGVSGAVAETSEQYRERVQQAEQAVCGGLTTILKTQLKQVSGVQQQLISVRQQTNGWEIIVGGGDPYLVAGAIMASGINIAGLVGSMLNVTGVTNANPGVVTTDKNHLFSNGQTAQMNGLVGITPLNGLNFTVTVLTEKTFSIGINTSTMPPYISGGVVTPNLRNVTVDIYDDPDEYGITFVQPPAQTTTIAVQYNTTQPNFASQAAVAQLAAPAIATYVAGLGVGAPISEIVLATTFTAAVVSVLDPNTISVLNFSVSINGVSTSPTGELIFGDPESYFSITSSAVSVTQV